MEQSTAIVLREDPAAAVERLRRIRAEFDRCWPWLDAAIVRFGRTHEKEHIWDLCVKREAYFFPNLRCAAVVRIVTYPTGLKELHVWLVGGNLKDVRDNLYPDIEAWGKKIGCHRMIAYGREGWLRALGGWCKHGTQRVKSLMGPQPTQVEISVLGYSELETGEI